MDQIKIFDRVYLEATGRGYVDELEAIAGQADHQRYIEWIVNTGRFWIFLGSRDFIEAIYEYFSDLDDEKADTDGYEPVIREGEDIDDFQKRIFQSISPITQILAPAFQVPPDLPPPAPSIQ